MALASSKTSLQHRPCRLRTCQPWFLKTIKNHPEPMVPGELQFDLETETPWDTPPSTPGWCHQRSEYFTALSAAQPRGKTVDFTVPPSTVVYPPLSTHIHQIFFEILGLAGYPWLPHWSTRCFWIFWLPRLITFTVPGDHRLCYCSSYDADWPRRFMVAVAYQILSDFTGELGSH